MKPILVVVDPALGMSKGHHAGIAERIARDRPTDVEIKYYVNKQFNETELELSDDLGISVYKLFSQDFYQYFHSKTNAGFISEYIFTLAKEYKCMLQDIDEKGKPHVLLYHTLNWEHINALSLALQLSQLKNDCIEHKILLMFYPGINHLGQITDITTSLNFCIALKAMYKIEKSEIMTSCFEYSQSYSKLLCSHSSIKVHPNLLAKPRIEKSQKQIHSLENGTIMLYLGDAKVEKGFLKLPERIKWFQQQCSSRAKLIIQYYLNADWGQTCLHDIGQQIEILTQMDSRIDLFVGYWPDEKLYQCLLNIDLMLLDYDSKVYSDKTSGLFWLAMNYEIPVLTSKKTWIIRESKKLGLPSTTWHKGDTIKKIDSRLKKMSSLTSEPEYVKQICLPFWEWYEKSLDCC